METRPLYYRLIGKVAVPCDFRQAGELLADDAARRVALNVIGDVTVSTVFICLDHATSGEPHLFETLIFGAGGQYDGQIRRYTTWAEAEAGHRSVVKAIEQPAE